MLTADAITITTTTAAATATAATSATAVSASSSGSVVLLTPPSHLPVFSRPALLFLPPPPPPPLNPVLRPVPSSPSLFSLIFPLSFPSPLLPSSSPPHPPSPSPFSPILPSRLQAVERSDDMARRSGAGRGGGQGRQRHHPVRIGRASQRAVRHPLHPHHSRHAQVSSSGEGRGGVSRSEKGYGRNVETGRKGGEEGVEGERGSKRVEHERNQGHNVAAAGAGEHVVCDRGGAADRGQQHQSLLPAGRLHTHTQPQQPRPLPVHRQCTRWPRQPPQLRPQGLRRGACRAAAAAAAAVRWGLLWAVGCCCMCGVPHVWRAACVACCMCSVLHGAALCCAAPYPHPNAHPPTPLFPATAQAGDTAIIVDRDVTAWPVGFYIGLASTDFYADQIDVASIVNVTAMPGNKWKVALSAPLSYSHFGEVVPDGFGGTIDERGEVVLLNRTVVIRGEDEAAPHNWEGGHFMVFFTQTAQMIEGVEFAQMGQQGQLGRYNIHFHLCGNQAGKSVVRKNVMHDSKQRCVVVHATFNLTVEENVAFNTRGHCFMVEEGGEQGNSFIRNLGVWTRAVEVKISDEETDDMPSTFWITNANNNYLGNVAAGSEDTGFWIELRDRVRGLSLQWPLINTLIPINYHRVGTFAGNVAHSCATGFRDYPRGFNPRFNASTLSDGDYWDDPVWVTMADFLLYKNLYVGAFVHNTDYVVFDGFTAADNVWGVNLHQVEGAVMRNLRVVGQTANYGNAWDCTEEWGSGGCAPVSGCNFPLAEGQQGRSVGWGGREEPVYGLVWTQSPWFTDGLFNNVVDGAKFAGFDSTCKPSAAVAVAGDRGAYWNAGNSLKVPPTTSPLLVTNRSLTVLSALCSLLSVHSRTLIIMCLPKESSAAMRAPMDRCCLHVLNKSK
ncbi:unnamed protein product [Closterium sp. NIES-53]